MVRRANECSVNVNEHMRGGDGSVKLTNLISGPEELLGKGRLYSVITLEPGCGIGSHVHEKESELFYIMKGSATYDDNGEEVTVYPGDVTIVEPGKSHGIANHTNESCEFMALILYQ